MSQLKLGIEMITKALSGLPMGSPLHNDAMKAVSTLSKHMADGVDDKSGMMQQLVQLARSAQTDPQRQAMMRAMPPPPQSAAPPGPPMAD